MRLICRNKKQTNKTFPQNTLLYISENLCFARSFPFFVKRLCLSTFRWNQLTNLSYQTGTFTRHIWQQGMQGWIQITHRNIFAVTVLFHIHIIHFLPVILTMTIVFCCWFFDEWDKLLRQADDIPLSQACDPTSDQELTHMY